RLANREYRYLSPVALVRRHDRRLIGLHSAALTNKPAISGMRPLVNRTCATCADQCRASDAAAPAQHLAALRIALSLENEADGAMVLRTAVGRVRGRERAEQHRFASERVNAAMAAGKLTPAQRDWAFGLALREPAEFDRWQASAPRVVVSGRTAAPPNV